jgi:polysaccharide pyruvyl transferase WcaK-like protein
MFDIDKWTEYLIKTAKYNAIDKPDLAFLVSHESEERKKAKQEFRLKSDIEEYKFFAETVKDMRDKYTFNTNPQIWHGEKFIEDFAKYLDYCKYRVKYRSYTINEMIGPDPIPV